MRTLKKTLALVLVLAMMLSFAVTANADFTDADEITNELEVATLVGMGIIEGMPDGGFEPTGTLTRAQAAKIIAYMDGVGKYAADPAETPFTDVPSTHWASGYIAYCAEAAIIDGYGDGNFGPSDKLTGYQWAKMLIAAGKVIPNTTKVENGVVSIVPADSLTGPAWQITTAKYATQLGLWTGLDANNKELISRDNACLVASNYLTADLDGNKTANDVMTKLGYTLTETYTTDETGAPITTYKLTNTKATGDAAKPVTIYTATSEPVLTYTAGVTLEKIVKDLDDTKAVIANAGAFNGAGKGELVEVYDIDTTPANTTNDYKIVVVKYALDVIEKSEIKPAVGEDAAYVLIDGLYKYETADFAEDDVVLYVLGTKAGKTVVVSAEVLEPVTGTVTAKGTGYFKLDGETMEIAAYDNTIDPVVGKDYAVYTDSYGYVVAVELVDNSVEILKTVYYGYLSEYAVKQYVPAVDGGLLGESKDAVPAAEKFEIVTAEGETVVLDGAITLDTNDKYATDFIASDINATTKAPENATVAADDLVAYKLDANGKLATIAPATATGDYDYVAGNATLTSDTLLLTSKTVFFYSYTDTTTGLPTIKAVVGYENAAGFTGSYEYFANTGNTAINAILVTGAPAEEDVVATTVTYAYAAAPKAEATVAADGKTAVEVYTGLYLDGVAGELTVKANATVKPEKGNLYSYTVKDGIATLVLVDDDASVEVTALAGTYYNAGGVTYIGEKTAYYQVVTAKDGSESVVAAEALPALDTAERTTFRVKTLYAADGATAAKPATVVYFKVVECYPDYPATRADMQGALINLRTERNLWYTLPTVGLSQQLKGDVMYLSGELSAINAGNYAQNKAALEQWLGTDAATFEAFLAVLEGQGYNVTGVENIAFVLFDTDKNTSISCVIETADGGVSCLKQPGTVFTHVNVPGFSWDISGLTF